MRFLGLTLATILLILAASPAAAADRPPVILVSIDGFRPDYLDRGLTPVMTALAGEGVRGAMRPSFPSKTFPNHYALVTGLRPDRNGIVENNMRDPLIPGVTFKMSDRTAVRDRRWWDEAEPIWVTAERAGVTTAPVFWPGSEAPIRGVRPRHDAVFDMDRPNEARVDSLLALLHLPPTERPGFLTLYLDIVDTAGHHFGPDSPQLNAAVQSADAVVGRLIAGLKARGLEPNLVIVADHGMAAISGERRVFLDDILPKDSYRGLAFGAFATLYPTEGSEAAVRTALLRAHDHLQCWAKPDIPSRFHYGRNPRVAPFFCLADVGWTVNTRDYKPTSPERGAHGFDPASPEMRAVFVAHGPAFRKAVTLAPFDNVSVYPLLARLLGVTPVPGDGRIEDVTPALR